MRRGCAQADLLDGDPFYTSLRSDVIYEYEELIAGT